MNESNCTYFQIRSTKTSEYTSEVINGLKIFIFYCLLYKCPLNKEFKDSLTVVIVLFIFLCLQ